MIQSFINTMNYSCRNHSALLLKPNARTVGTAAERNPLNMLQYLLKLRINSFFSLVHPPINVTSSNHVTLSSRTNYRDYTKGQTSQFFSVPPDDFSFKQFNQA